MKIVKFVSSVDPSKCNGDKLCERVCPAGAIRVVDKEARVDQARCVACSKCWDRCPSNAIEMLPRSEPVDQDKIFELCYKAAVRQQGSSGSMRTTTFTGSTIGSRSIT